MKNNLSYIINNHESAVSPFLFDQIMLERNNRLRRKKWRAWTVILGALLIFLAGTYYLTSSPVPTPIKSNILPIAQKSNKQSAQKNQSLTPHLEAKQSSTGQQTLAGKITPTQTDKIAKAKTTQPKNHLAKAKKINPIQTHQPSTNTISLASTSVVPTTTSPNMSPPSFERKESSDRLLPSTTKVTNHLAIINQLPSLMSLIQNPPAILNLPDNDCYSFIGRNRSPSSLFIDFLGSPDLVKSTLVAKNRELENHKKTRENTETYSPSFSAQVGIGLRTGQGIVFRTGVNYSQYETKFFKKDDDYKKVVIEQIFDQQGNLVRIDTITTIGSLEIQNYNKQQFIGIPLTVGYMSLGKKMSIGFNAGAQFNIKKSSSGRYISTDGQVTNFTISSIDPTPIYKTSVGIQGIANLTFAYALGDHFDIILAPHVKITPNPITESKYFLTEKLMTTGIWLGGRVRF